MTIEDWPEPVEDESDIEDEPLDEGNADSDQDPEFVEREALFGFNAEDEPEIDDNDLPAFLEEHLYDMDEEDSLDMCKSYMCFARLITYLFLL